MWSLINGKALALMMIMMLSKGEHNLPSLLRDLYKNVISMKKLTVSKNKNPFYDLQFSGSVQMLKIPSFHRLHQWVILQNGKQKAIHSGEPFTDNFFAGLNWRDFPVADECPGGDMVAVVAWRWQLIACRRYQGSSLGVYYDPREHKTEAANSDHWFIW